MVRRLCVRVLVDNNRRGIHYLGAHGLALWIEADGRRIILDSGVRDPLAWNLRKLRLDVSSADALVLSHGHYDHTGGVTHLLGDGRRMPVYLHPDATVHRYKPRSGKAGRARQIGMPEAARRLLAERQGDLVFTLKPCSIAEGVHVTGEIPRRTPYEDTGGQFFLDEECSIPDPIDDDQALYVETGRGPVVLLGCAHAGVVNTLDHVAQLTGRDRIHAVLGGMHLKSASPARLRATADALRKYAVDVVVPCHCTGTEATEFLKSSLPGRCLDCYVGKQFEFGEGARAWGDE